jgi:hypothetical protein
MQRGGPWYKLEHLLFIVMIWLPIDRMNDAEKPVFWGSFHQYTGYLGIDYVFFLFTISWQNSHNYRKENLSPIWPFLFLAYTKMEVCPSVGCIYPKKIVACPEFVLLMLILVMQTWFSQAYELWLLPCSPSKFTTEEDAKRRTLYKAVQLPLLG